MHQQSEQHGRYSHEPPTRRPPGEIPANRTQGDSARYAGQGGAAGGPARTVPSELPNRRAVVGRDVKKMCGFRLLMESLMSVWSLSPLLNFFALCSRFH